MASTAPITRRPPSTFTAAQPACDRNRPALATASEALVWYERKGMSPTTSARFAAPETAAACRTIESIVAEKCSAAVDGHLDRVADEQDIEPRLVEQGRRRGVVSGHHRDGLAPLRGNQGGNRDR
jgi:hypothetical protein